MPSTILSDNGVSSGSAGIKTTGSNDGTLALQTTTSGGTATTAVTIDTSQNVGIGLTNPSGTLHVKAQAGQGAPFYLSTTDATANAQAVFVGSRQYQIGTGNASSGFAGSLFFYDGTAGATRAGIDSSGNFQFNSGYGSSATAYGCRAWVNFNGTGTVAIRASGNVTSITDNGVGQYTINFTNALPDSNYSVAGLFTWSNNANPLYIGTLATSSVPISVLEANAYVDRATITISVFR
jgi:hypothetical protein